MNHVTIDFPASYRFLSIVSSSIDALFEGFPDQQDSVRPEFPAGLEKEVLVFQMKLAVQEACTNIIDHAYGLRGQSIQPSRECERIEASLILQEEPCQFRVDLFDSGQSFPLPEVKLPNIDELQDHGYGLFLIHELMSEVRYEPYNSQPQVSTCKNHWQLVKEIA